MSLHALIARQIRNAGPISVAEYMAMCLMHPEYGYYNRGMPFGAAGDFVTAPEISQMFGELVGACLAQVWLDQGAPKRFTLAELGPGRGTLMADILRATQGVPGFVQAAEIVLVEASNSLRYAQRQLLGDDMRWIDGMDALPEQPLFVVANEFFDALPIRQFVRDGARWRERQVGLTDGRLGFGLAPPAPQPALKHRLEDTVDGDLVEDCPGAAPLIGGIAERIAAHGGVALIVDYGDWRSLGDTLQAVQGHRKTDPLAEPGKSDLSAHVDFEALARAVAPCQHTKLTPQGVFLERLGITQRARTLARTLAGGALEDHIAAHRRLTHPSEMGNLFKAMGVVPQGRAFPPGLE